MGYTIENNEPDAVESILLGTKQGFDIVRIDSSVLNVQPAIQTQAEVYFQIEDWPN